MTKTLKNKTLKCIKPFAALLCALALFAGFLVSGIPSVSADEPEGYAPVGFNYSFRIPDGVYGATITAPYGSNPANAVAYLQAVYTFLCNAPDLDVRIVTGSSPNYVIEDFTIQSGRYWYVNPRNIVYDNRDGYVLDFSFHLINAFIDLPVGNEQVYLNASQKAISFTDGTDRIFIGFNNIEVFITAIPPSPPVVEHYNFSGWYLDPALDIVYSGQYVSTDVLFYPKYTIKKYTISYVMGLPNLTQGNSTPDAFSLFTPPDPPDYVGYQFIGWYLDSNFINVYDPTIPILHDMTLYARWQTASIQVGIYLDGEYYDTLTVGLNQTYRNIKNLIEHDADVKINMYMNAAMTLQADLDGYITSDRLIYAKKVTDVPGGDSSDPGGDSSDPGDTDPGDTGDVNDPADMNFFEKVSGFFSDTWQWFAIGGIAAAASLTLYLIFARR
jgi:uncharacterized repeat protein (TIGR02543 family)